MESMKQGSVNTPNLDLVWFVARQRECKKEERKIRGAGGALWMQGGTKISLSLSLPPIYYITLS